MSAQTSEGQPQPQSANSTFNSTLDQAVSGLLAPERAVNTVLREKFNELASKFEFLLNENERLRKTLATQPTDSPLLNEIKSELKSLKDVMAAENAADILWTKNRDKDVMREREEITKMIVDTTNAIKAADEDSKVLAARVKSYDVTVTNLIDVVSTIGKLQARLTNAIDDLEEQKRVNATAVSNSPISELKATQTAIQAAIASAVDTFTKLPGELQHQIAAAITETKAARAGVKTDLDAMYTKLLTTKPEWARDLAFSSTPSVREGPGPQPSTVVDVKSIQTNVEAQVGRAVNELQTTLNPVVERLQQVVGTLPGSMKTTQDAIVTGVNNLITLQMTTLVSRYHQSLTTALTDKADLATKLTELTAAMLGQAKSMNDFIKETNFRCISAANASSNSEMKLLIQSLQKDVQTCAANGANSSREPHQLQINNDELAQTFVDKLSSAMNSSNGFKLDMTAVKAEMREILSKWQVGSDAKIDELKTAVDSTSASAAAIQTSVVALAQTVGNSSTKAREALSQVTDAAALLSNNVEILNRKLQSLAEDAVAIEAATPAKTLVEKKSVSDEGVLRHTDPAGSDGKLSDYPELSDMKKTLAFIEAHPLNAGANQSYDGFIRDAILLRKTVSDPGQSLSQSAVASLVSAITSIQERVDKLARDPRYTRFYAKQIEMMQSALNELFRALVKLQTRRKGGKSGKGCLIPSKTSKCRPERSTRLRL